MVASIVLLAAVIAVVNGRPELTDGAQDNGLVLQTNMMRTNCSMNLEVVYPAFKGGPPYPLCSNWCQEIGGLWIDGVVYKKLSELEDYGLMVEITFVNGSLKKCKMVPYDTAGHFSARKEAQNPCMESFPSSDKVYPEEDIVLSVTERIPQSSNPNPMQLRLEGFTRVGNSYYMVSPEPMRWQDAVRYCAEREAPLAFIESAQETNHLKKVLSTSVWIGLNDLTAEGIFANLENTPIRYSNWERGQPDNDDGVEDCVMLYGGRQLQWNDFRCWNYQRALCKHPLVAEPQAQYSCPTGYWKHKSSCYILSSSADTYSHGELFCLINRAYPVFINSQDEHSFLAGKLSVAAFIGYSDRDEEGKFLSRRFGIPLFQRWNSNEPNDKGWDEDCVSIEPRYQFYWNDVPCSDKFRILCEKAAEIKS